MSGISKNDGKTPSMQMHEGVAEQTRAQQKSFITRKNGDAIGNNFLLPGGDFAHFLGYKAPTMAERTHKEQVTGARVIEMSLHDAMQKVGKDAADRGNEFRNMYISWGRFNNEPGRERDMIKDALDANPARVSTPTFAGKSTVSDSLTPPSAVNMPYAERQAQIFSKMEGIQQKSRNQQYELMLVQYRFQEMSKQEGTISNLMKVRHDAISRSIQGSH